MVITDIRQKRKILTYHNQEGDLKQRRTWKMTNKKTQQEDNQGQSKTMETCPEDNVRTSSGAKAQTKRQRDNGRKLPW